MGKVLRFAARRRLPGGDVAMLRRIEAGQRRFRGPVVRRSRAQPWHPLAALVLLAGVAMVSYEPAARTLWDRVSGDSGVAAISSAPTINLRFSKCSRAGQQNCVIDGDTLRFGGETIRVADIDTPETRDYHCSAEKARGDAATRRMLELVNAGPFQVQGYERDEDVYGRKLRILTREGTSLGETLVAEGLARRWDGARHPWC